MTVAVTEVVSFFGKATVVSGSDGDGTKEGLIDDDRQEVEKLWGVKPEMQLIFVPNFQFPVGEKGERNLGVRLVGSLEGIENLGKITLLGFYFWPFCIEEGICFPFADLMHLFLYF